MINFLPISSWHAWESWAVVPSGACENVFYANTFEEMAELSKQHGMDMFKQQDSAHLAAMQEMQELMKNPEDLKTWFDSKRKEFEALPENN